MFFERLKASWRTLRFRLMMWNAWAVVLTGVATLIGLREGVRFTLLNEMDQILIEDIREIDLALDERGKPDIRTLEQNLDRKARGHVQHGWFAQLIGADGRQIWTSVNTPTELPPLPEMPDFTPVVVGNYRLVQHRNPDNHGSAVVVRVGTSLDFLTEDVRRIDRLVGLTASTILIIAPLGGYILALRATRPLGEIIRTTARLRPRKLDERLPIRGTGDELDQLSQTVNNLLDRIGLYLEQHRDFLANAAHELRSPLAAIHSSVEVALGGNRTRDEYEELLQEIIEECSSLETLINHLLLLSEAEADRLKIDSETVPLHEIVKKSVDMFQGAAEFKDVDLVATSLAPVEVSGNRHHLWQVVNNLIDNSLKFTPAGGRVSVELSADVSGRWVVLRVSDTGIGIPPEDLHRVFERFYRVDKSRERERAGGGNGLGLSICDTIVTAHGGQIRVESQVGQGTTFTVYLPAAHHGGSAPVPVLSHAAAEPGPG